MQKVLKVSQKIPEILFLMSPFCSLILCKEKKPGDHARSHKITFLITQDGQLSAAVRADFLNEHSNKVGVGVGGYSLCQDGQPKVISVIVGCGQADLEMRSSCSDNVDFPKGK